MQLCYCYVVFPRSNYRMLLRTITDNIIPKTEALKQIQLILVQTKNDCKAPLQCVDCILFARDRKLYCSVSLDKRRTSLQEILQMYDITEADLFEAYL